MVDVDVVVGPVVEVVDDETEGDVVVGLVEVVDVGADEVEVVELEELVIDVAVVKVVEVASEVEVLDDDVEVEEVEEDEEDEEEDVVVVDVVVAGVDVDVVGVDVVDVVVEAGSVPPSHEGSTAPGEKVTPGPDRGGGLRVGTTISFDPRNQVVARGSAGEAGVAEDGIEVLAAVVRSDGTAPAAARTAPWAPTSAPAVATTVIPSLNVLMIFAPGLPPPGLVETTSRHGSGRTSAQSPGSGQFSPPGRARPVPGTHLGPG